MGFLKKFFRNVYQEDAVMPTASAFEAVSEEQLEVHLGVARYGSFTLSDAVRPSYALEVVPSCGFRHDTYRDEQSKKNVPVLMAAASREQLFEVRRAEEGVDAHERLHPSLIEHVARGLVPPSDRLDRLDRLRDPGK